jgi:hypothetical protein
MYPGMWQETQVLIFYWYKLYIPLDSILLGEYPNRTYTGTAEAMQEDIGDRRS